jgi:Asp-tRNAAsn/Glu-tRNAGln amidotransferase B subunit (PET112 homolog)
MEFLREAANLMLNELFPRLKKAGIPIAQSPVLPLDIRALAILKSAGVFSTHEIRQLIRKRIEEGERLANPAE